MGSPLLAPVLWFFALQLVLKLELKVLGTTEVTARGFSRQRMISFCCAEEVAVGGADSGPPLGVFFGGGTVLG